MNVKMNEYNIIEETRYRMFIIIHNAYDIFYVK